MADSTALPATLRELAPRSGTRRPTRISGTTHGGWQPLAAALLDAMSKHLGGPAATLQAAIPSGDGASRWILLVDRPEAMLARWQATGTPGQLARTLDTWCASACAALILTVARGNDVLLLPGDATPNDAGWIADALGHWDPLLAGITPTLPDPLELDPRWLDIGQRICRARPDAQRLYDALRALSGRLPERLEREVPHRDGTSFFIASAGAAESSGDPPPAIADDAPLDSLTQRLHETQRELEDVYLQLQIVRADRQTGVAGRRSLRVGHARLVQPDTATTDLLLLELRQLESGHRTIPRLRAGLVRPEGQPGLRLYATGGEPEIVSAWQSDGTDAGGIYMQFVPATDADRRRLQYLGAADWHVVSGLVALLQTQIEAMGDAVPQSWHIAAAHLARQLDELPARFRYDGLNVSAAPAPDGGSALHIEFTGAGFGRLDLHSVRLKWSPAGLWWLLDTKSALLPLAGWPIAADGTPAAELQLPVGPVDSTEKSRRWQSLLDGDRALLLAVLDALPACVPLAPERAAAFGGAERLAADVRGLLRDAHRVLARGRLLRRLSTLPAVGRWVPPTPN